MRKPIASTLKGVSAFARDEGGNFAMLFGISGAALILCMGLGIDYYAGVSSKARLDAAADAAALAAVNAAKAYYLANNGSQSLTTLVTNAQTQGTSVAQAAFKANAGTTLWTADPNYPQLTWNAFGNMTFSATMTYQGKVPTMFGNLVKVSQFGLSGSATAQSQMPLYEDFYVISDTSGSMGLPTSDSDQLRLIAENPDNPAWAWAYPTGCQFACHYPGSQGFAYTQSHGINLKLNDVGKALNNLLTTAKNDELVTNQYRIGMWTYNYTLQQRAPLSADLSTSSQSWSVANNLANYLDDGTQSVWYATYFNALGWEMKPYLNTAGFGTSQTDTKPYIIIITDGIENHSDQYQRFNLPDVTSTGSLCSVAKAAGYTVAVILIPYSPLLNANHQFAGDEDGWVNYLVDQTTFPNPGNGQGQTLNPGQNSETNMAQCPTDNTWFFKATSAQAINDAMQKIFYQASHATRLTQ